MKPVYICGVGAVSPGGWGVGPFREVVSRGVALPAKLLERPASAAQASGGNPGALRIRPVPEPVSKPAFLAHPRLRRVSPLTHYGAAAALEATAGLPEDVRRSAIGLVFCLQIGPVQYASRFFHEILRDPSTASPLLFPETVFSAPASHVSALLGQPRIVYTLMGDPGAFLEGLALGAQWLQEGRVGACLVVGAEEFNWLQVDAARHFDRRAVFGPGAGAVCLALERHWSLGVELEAITDAHTYTASKTQAEAAEAMRAQMPPMGPNELLCDGLGGAPRTASAERAAWSDWTGPRVSPKTVLGEGFMAAAGWQCVAAACAVAGRDYRAANVSLVGCNQQAIGARFKTAAPASKG